jgi:pyridoxamine 5'-phosphate oxidase
MLEKVNFSQPFEKFKNWFEKACATKEIVEPTAMCLATVGENLAPSSRMVLLKKFNEKGFCFFTNFNSRKGGELKKNSNVALCFYWGILGYQIRVEGSVEEVSTQEADDYFASRRRESRIGAWASKQSSEMKNWSEFEERIKQFEKEFEGKEVARPPFWSGYRVVPKRIEFWEEGDFRIHHRKVYERAGDGWNLTEIYP